MDLRSEELKKPLKRNLEWGRSFGSGHGGHPERERVSFQISGKRDDVRVVRTSVDVRTCGV